MKQNSRIIRVFRVLAVAAMLFAAALPVSAAEPLPLAEKVYRLELSRWGVYNDGTHPVETTAGLNAALQWASGQSYNVFKVPAGTYLIAKGKGGTDPNARINMVSNMTLELDPQAVIQKEANGYTGYQTMYVGGFVHDAVLRGGTYRGDRNSHDYTVPGTHEGGYGIITAGSSRITIENVKAEQFTGDGLAVGAFNAYFQDLYPNHFELGTIDRNGRKTAATDRVRTAKHWPITHPSFAETKQMVIDNIQHLPWTFDVIFYKEDGTFISTAAAQRKGEYVAIPAGAAQFSLVFKAAETKQAYLEIWNKVQSSSVIVQHSEFAFNRRQGITVGGGNGVLIRNNRIHDQSGTAPQSGIDVEGGAGDNGYINKNITIQNNEFYNNKAYDIILYDGSGAVVEGNRLGSKGAIGLAVSPPFTGAKVNNNTFDGTRIVAYHDVSFDGNRMIDSYTYLEGPNISVTNMTFTDAMFSISSKVPFGVSASNITIRNNKKSDSGLTIWNQPVHLRDVTIIGESTLRSLSGGVADGSIFDNLKVIGYNAAYGLDLPRGTYNSCVFEAAPPGRSEPSIGKSGRYVFNQCSFKGSGTGLGVYHKDADVKITGSRFDVLGNAGAISVGSAKSIIVENSAITANSLTSADTQLIGIGSYWRRTEPYQTGYALIKGNTMTSNLAAKGISTIYAGAGAPAYTVENNVLHKAKLDLKPNDKSKGNQELPE
ncbi:right-handed parallel beta-helix repeat-containing protein [Paenibacillus chartarius]|uniref:Right-handed parallel beta-helix repeat-containing protein n=1 Tax=Paenibacillus chartarius TaxID=747481 RepID=A0ABV6DR86_9BACL